MSFNNTHTVRVEGGQEFIVNAPNANAAKARVAASTGLKVVGCTSSVRGAFLKETNNRSYL